MNHERSTIRIGYRLRRRSERSAVAAVLFEHTPVAAVLQTCAALGVDPAGRTFRAGNGLLLKLDGPSDGVNATGAVLLRALAPNLLIPVDADLAPALLDDEAAGLTRGRGWVFLPSGAVLAFDPNAPVESASLVVSARRRLGEWKPLSCPRRLAECIDEITVQLPGNAFDPNANEDDVDDAVFDPTESGVGTEAPHPKASGPLEAFTGRTMLEAGRWIMGLGQALGWAALAKLGANAIRQAMEVAPRLSESVLGAQEAALRALLNEFRDGDPERAMRHALPLGDPSGSRGADIDTGAKLPTHNLRYALNDLLGRGDQASGRVWLGGQSLVQALAREYRQAAEQALHHGDHRRAAFIYGKLLHDYRMAAHALLRGGLYRDAAAVFLSRLDDTRSAAAALESAGDIDGALRLYRSREDHVAAGDLLRKIGEEDAALVEFQLAADRIAASDFGHLAAGDLLLAKTGRTDLALVHFQAGWQARPARNAIPCAHRLARLYADSGRTRALMDLLGETDAFFLAPGQDQAAGQFYNELVRVADAPQIAEIKDRLHDHALRALATKMRQHESSGVKPGTLLATLFSRPGIWAPAVISDAEFALSASLRATEKPAAGTQRSQAGDHLRAGYGTVTAACSAGLSGDVFLGFENGDVLCYCALSSEVSLVGHGVFPVVSLASDPNGRWLNVLSASGGSRRPHTAEVRHQSTVSFETSWGAMCFLTAYERKPDGNFRRSLDTSPDIVDAPWMTPAFAHGKADVIGVWTGEQLQIVNAKTLIPTGHPLVPEWQNLNLARLLPWPGKRGYSILFQEGSSWHRFDPGTGFHDLSDVLRGEVTSPPPLHARPAPLEVWGGGDRLELSWIGPYGTLYWTSLSISDGSLERVASGTSGERGGYRASAILRHGLVAGIAADRVDWFWGGAERLRHYCTNLGGLDNIVDGFACRLTGELILVNARGYIRRIFVPS